MTRGASALLIVVMIWAALPIAAQNPPYPKAVSYTHLANPSLLHLNHLVIVAIGMDLPIKIREQPRPIARHKTYARDFALLERFVWK